MHLAERLLLYATALCAGAILLFDDSSPPQSVGAQGTSTLQLTQPLDANPSTAGKSEIVLHDKLGRERIVLKVADDGRPSVILKGDVGQDALTLEADNNGAARLYIGSAGRHAELRLDAKGDAALELLNGEQGQVVVSNSRDGSSSVSMSGKGGLPAIRLSRDLHGNADLRLGSLENPPAMTLTATRAGELAAEFLGAGRSRAAIVISDSGDAALSLTGRGGTESLISAHANGAAEIAINGTNQLGGPSMSLLPNGDMGIRLKRSDQNAGPHMILYQNGHGEVAVVGPEGKDGPALSRTPQGLGTITIQNKAVLGPKMTLAPDGTASLGISGPSGKSMAGIKLEAQRAPRLIVVDSKDNTIFSFPPGPVHEQSDKKAPER